MQEFTTDNYGYLFSPNCVKNTPCSKLFLQKKKRKKNKEKKRFVLVSSQEIERQKKVLNDTILNKDGKFFLVYYCNCGAFNIRTFQESSLSIFRYRRVLSAFPFTRPEAKQIYSDICTHAKYVYVCMDAH